MIGKLATRPPRSVWDLLDDALDLYRMRFLHFAALAAVLYLPVQILGVALSTGVHAWFLHQQAGQDKSTSNLISFGELFAQNGVLQLPLMLSTLFLSAAVAQSVWGELHGTIATTPTVLRQVLRRAPHYLVIGLLCGITNVLAFCFFGMGHWVTSVLFLTVPATLQLEGVGFWGALRRAKRRQGGSLWLRSLGLLLLTEMVLGLLYLGTWTLLQFAFDLIPTPTDSDATNRDLRQHTLSAAAGSLCRYLLAPVSALATSLLYVDLRIRHEALDLVTAAQEAQIPLAPERSIG